MSRAAHAGEQGTDLRDARTGEILWSKPSPDVGRGLAADIDPRHPGYECWGAVGGLYTVAWRVVADDGHPVTGTFTFTVDLATPSPAAPTSARCRTC